MYDAGEDYLNSMFTFDRQIDIYVEVQYNTGVTETIYNDGIVEDSFSLDMAAVNSNAFNFGSSYMSELKIGLTNKRDYLNQFTNALIMPYIIAQVTENSTDTVTIPMGVYDVITTEVNDNNNNLTLNCYDFMNRFNKKCGSSLNGKLYKLLKNCCAVCGVAFGMTAAQVKEFPGANINYSIGAGSFESYRDVLEYFAEIMCGFVTFDRYGRLIVRSFLPTTPKTLPESFISTASYDNTEFKVRKLQYNGPEQLSASNANQSGVTVNYCTDNTVYKSLWSEFKDEKQSLLEEAVNFVEPILFKGAVLTIWGDAAIDLGDSLYILGYGRVIVMSINYTLHGLQKIGCYGLSKDSFSGTSKSSRDISNLASNTDEIKIDLRTLNIATLNIPKRTEQLNFSVVMCNSNYKVEMQNGATESTIPYVYDCIMSDVISLNVLPKGGAASYRYTIKYNENNNGWITVADKDTNNLFFITISSILNNNTVVEITIEDIENNLQKYYYQFRATNSIEVNPIGSVLPNAAVELTNIETEVPEHYTTIVSQGVTIPSKRVNINNELTVYSECYGLITYFNTFITGGVIANSAIVCKQEIHPGYNHISWYDCIINSKLPLDLVITIGIGISCTCDIHIINNGSRMNLFSLHNGNLMPQSVQPTGVQYIFKNSAVTIST